MTDHDYLEFRKQYELQHPASIPVLEEEISEYPKWTRFAVLTAFVAAALVSGVHTVPTVWKSIEVGELITPAVRNMVSLSSLVAIELAILLSAYLMAKGVRLAYGVMAIASAVAIMANLYSVITAFQRGNDDGSLVVAVVLGIGAPLIALFMGKMFVDIHRSDRIQHSRAQKIYREACKAFDKEINNAWKSYQKTTKPSMSNRPDVSNGQNYGQNVTPSASILGHIKRPDASEIVLRYLQENPQELDTNARELAARLNVGKSTVNNVQRQLKGMTEPTNGHHENV